MNNFGNLLAGGDLRTIGNANIVAKLIQNQKDFDELFTLMFHADRLIGMRAADAIEKITVRDPQYLDKHKTEVFALSKAVKNKELKWHLALLLSRLNLNGEEFPAAWNILKSWVANKGDSKIVRINSMQSLFELSKQNKPLQKKFLQLIHQLEKENIPSINARIRLLNKIV